MRRRRIDVGFARPALPAEAGLAQRLILDEPHVAALPRAHPLAEKDAIARAELSDDAFVLHPARPEPSVTGLIVNALARRRAKEPAQRAHPFGERRCPAPLS
ncbi:MAG: LysR substrate-binding domain-containing protein [Bradyrhizobium sp.]|uniref:LysR substrate-binding domain-containing protein n=1 Tax=Bradyrhizobium sp. TaxID=376 RepID=UPI00391DD085